MCANNIIEIKNLHKVFGSGDHKIVALENVSISVKEGEIYGIIGLSGAGKSTLVRCINLLETPTEGSVEVNGKQMTSLTAGELRRARQSIGMIFQGFNLLMQRTALDNICFPLEIAGVAKADARARAREMLDTVGLADKANAYPAQLSGGQKQRVAIARALATNPKVLLCDEATSALDPTTTQSILQLIQDLNRKLGVTVVIITHEMRVIEQICNTVAIISKSHIEEVGPVSEVFIRPRSEVAKQLIFSQGQAGIAMGTRGRVLRLVFDGQTTDKPIVASMILHCGAPINIVFADAKSINGKTYGQMVIQVPEDEQTVKRMLAFLADEKIVYEDESDYVYATDD